MTSLAVKNDVGLFTTTMMFSTTVCPDCGKLRSADQLTLCKCGGLFCGIGDCPSHIDCPYGTEADDAADLPVLGAWYVTRSIALCAILLLTLLTGFGWVRYEQSKHTILVNHTDLPAYLPGYGYMPINR